MQPQLVGIGLLRMELPETDGASPGGIGLLPERDDVATQRHPYPLFQLARQSHMEGES